MCKAEDALHSVGSRAATMQDRAKVSREQVGLGGSTATAAEQWVLLQSPPRWEEAEARGVQGSWVRFRQGFIRFFGQDFLKTFEYCMRRQRIYFPSASEHNRALWTCVSLQKGFAFLLSHSPFSCGKCGFSAIISGQ